MSREVIIDVKRRVKCDRCGEVQDAHKTIQQEDSDRMLNPNADNQALAFAAGRSGWETRLRFQAATLGWTDSSPVEAGQIGFHGELCLSCSTALKEVLERFFADGIVGMLGMAKEQQPDPRPRQINATGLEDRCPCGIHGDRCTLVKGHPDYHLGASGRSF